PMDDPLAAEFAGVFSGVGYVVAMREEDAPDATGFVKLAHKLAGPAWRIDQPVAFGMPDEVTRPAERFLRRKAAVVDLVLNLNREVVRGVASRSLRADGCRGTGHERLQRRSHFPRRLRLTMYERIGGRFGESGRRDLAAGIAIYAGGIHEELAGYVLGDLLRAISHQALTEIRTQAASGIRGTPPASSCPRTVSRPRYNDRPDAGGIFPIAPQSWTLPVPP